MKPLTFFYIALSLVLIAFLYAFSSHSPPVDAPLIVPIVQADSPIDSVPPNLTPIAND